MHLDRDLLLGVIALAIIVASLTVHECCHAWMALRLGDRTAYLAGRLTLNPIPHIDPLQSILLPILFYVTSGGKFCFGLARPVPIDATKFRRPVEGLALSALAGPASNLQMAIMAAILAGLLSPRAPEGSINEFVILHVLIPFYLTNIMLAAFNMIPIPPLDGSRLLRFFLTPTARDKYDSLEPFGILVLIGLMAFGLLNPFLLPVQSFAIRLFEFLQFT